MSMYVYVSSVCGKSGSMVDTFDLPLNNEGVICCGNCKTIMECREAWYQVYDGVLA